MPIRKTHPTLDGISKYFRVISALKGIRGPLSFRRALRDDSGERMSLMQMGYALQLAHPHRYSSSTISLWERTERGERLPARYAMSKRAKSAYYALLSALVSQVSHNRFILTSQMTGRVWRFRLTAYCVKCGRPFQPTTIRAVRCVRCRKR